MLIPCGLLGRHVIGRAHRKARLREAAPSGGSHGQRDPEICDDRLAVLYQDVRWLDVPMNHAASVRVLQRLGHRGSNPHRFVNRQLLVAVQTVPECVPLHVGHHIEQEGIRLARIEQRQDMRVLQVGRRLDLSQKPFRADDCGQLGLQDLERDLSLMPEIISEINRGHPALTELALDLVATL